jgi:protoporphyrinogen oxidase
MRVAILGGGACGLSAAHRLVEAGAQPIVLEREARPGGLCGTHERDGFRFDFGGHRFLSRSRALDALVRSLVGDALLTRTRSSAVLHEGRRYRYPLELDDVLRTAGLGDGARALASYARERVRQRIRRAPDASFRDWVVHRFGEDLYGRFFGPYTQKLWGLPPDEISADWAAQRISLESLGEVAARLVGLRRGAVPRTYARRYLYPRLGIGQIFERMAEVVRAGGGAIALAAEVTGLDLHRGRIRAVRYRDAGGERAIACDAVISTVALPLVARWLGARGEIAQSAARLRFRGIRLHHLLLDGGEISPHTWMYVSEPRFRIARIQEPRHRSPEMAPPGCTSLMLEIPCTPGDDLWSAPDGAVRDLCLDELRALGFDVAGRVRDHFSAFVPEGYPIYHLDYRRDRARVLGFAGETANLISVGRQGAFRYVFMDTAMEMGRAAAQALLDGAPARGLSELDGGARLLEAQALTV